MNRELISLASKPCLVFSIIEDTKVEQVIRERVDRTENVECRLGELNTVERSVGRRTRLTGDEMCKP